MPGDPHDGTKPQRDPGSLLASQIEALAGNRVRVTQLHERAWASITFSGTRYSFSIDCTSAAEPDELKNLAKALPDHEFAIPGNFVADILVTDQSDAQLRVEILSIIDPVETFRD